MNYLGTLAEEVGVDERTLRRAVNQGTLRAERVSPRKLRLSSLEGLYLRRQWPLLGSLRVALRTEPNVSFALLFGSTARGDDGPDSDVDVLVDVEDASLGRILALERRLAEALGRDVDMVTMEAAGANATLLSLAVADGRVLVDRAGAWSRLRAEAGAIEERARREERRLEREARAGVARLAR